MSNRLQQPSLRKDPPSLNEYWSSPSNNTGGMDGTATTEKDSSLSEQQQQQQHQQQQSTNEDQLMSQSPSPSDSLRNRDTFPVLRSGEVVTAKNTLRSNSHIGATVQAVVPSHNTKQDTIQTTIHQDNVLVDACLVDVELSDGVNASSNDAQLPVQQIPMACADTNAIHAASSNNSGSAAAGTDASVAAASRIQVPKKYIPFLVAALVVVFGAGAAAGICGTGLCVPSKEAASLLTPSNSAPASVVAGPTTTKPITSTIAPMPIPAAAPTSLPKNSTYHNQTNSTAPSIRSPNIMAPATSPRSPSRATSPTFLSATIVDVAKPTLTASPAPPPVATANPTMASNDSTNPAASIVNFINSITLSGRGIANPTTSTEVLATEEVAVQWLIVNDPLQLSPDTNINQFRLQQRYALLTLMVQQGWESQWVASSSDNHECEWTGIACGQGDFGGDVGVQRVVVGLSLSGFSLRGSIPADLGLLYNLVGLDVSFNALGGSLPESIGNWIDLQQFLVNDNSLTGTIPETIVNWGVVAIIRLGNNQFTGSVPEGICDGRLAYLGADCIFEVACSCCTSCSDILG
jgi:hypothetical protein